MRHSAHAFLSLVPGIPRGLTYLELLGRCDRRAGGDSLPLLVLSDAYFMLMEPLEVALRGGKSYFEIPRLIS